MELPPALRQAVDRFLQGTPLEQLRTASGRLSNRYRTETRDGSLHLDDVSAVKAYLAARLPATYAAVRASMAYVTEAAPDFAPVSLLDVGAGPGTVLWAAVDCWDGLEKATMIEASEAVRSAGRTLATDAALPASDWLAGDATGSLLPVGAADLVTLSYVLDEVQPQTIGPLVDRLWALTTGLLLIVEPGTVPWEDEKFIYLAASRTPAAGGAARILAPPRAGKGRIGLKLCLPDGNAREEIVSKRDGEVFRSVRRLDWGDSLSAEN